MQGKFSFSISSKTDILENFDLIFSLKSTQVVKKNQIIGKYKAQHNKWIYSECFTEDTFSSILEEFVLKFTNFSNIICNITKKYDVKINIYIQSEMGQFGYHISSKVFQNLNQLKLDLNFHILSFGLVSD